MASWHRHRTLRSTSSEPSPRATFVVLHYNMKIFPDDLGHAVVDIVRVEDGRIVEHWDVMQHVPAESANTNGMF